MINILLQYRLRSPIRCALRARKRLACNQYYVLSYSSIAAKALLPQAHCLLDTAVVVVRTCFKHKCMNRDVLVMIACAVCVFVQLCLREAERFPLRLPLFDDLQARVNRVKTVADRIREVFPNPATHTKGAAGPRLPQGIGLAIVKAAPDGAESNGLSAVDTPADAPVSLAVTAGMMLAAS